MENIKADKKLVKNWWKYRDEWISKGKSDKFLRLLSSARFYEDWEVDEPEEIIWKKYGGEISSGKWKHSINPQKI